MNCILEHFQTEIVIKHSRFIAEVFPVESQSKARELLKEQKQKYFDATHVVHAFVIGKSAEVLGMSDDGEPSGTAGRPVLDVLKGSGCTNIMLTVTRYFGGTLLGTGGLVKAYSDSAKAVLEITKFEPLIEKTEFKFSLPYDMYEKIKYHFNHYHIDSIKEDFTENITISGIIYAEEFSNFKTEIEEISNARIKIQTC